MITSSRLSIYLEANMENVEKQTMNDCKVYVCISWLRSLLELELITQKEFDRMVKMTAKHYGSNIKC